MNSVRTPVSSVSGTISANNALSPSSYLPQHVPSNINTVNTTVPAHKSLGSRLEVSSTKLVEEHCKRLCKALEGESGSTVRVCDLSYNDLGPLWSEKIANALECPPHLEEVLLRHNDIGQAGCDALASVVNVQANLRLIDIRGNRLKADDVRKLIKAIAISTTVTQLGLAANDLGAAGGALIASALEKNNFVTNLDLRQNDLAADGVQHIASLLERPTCVLTNLSLYANRLGVEGTIAFAKGLGKNRSLEVLTLGSNRCTDAACAALASAFASQNTLTHIDLKSNEITDVGLRPLMAAFSGMKKLQKLYLSANPLRRASADCIVQAFVHHEGLKVLDLWSCQLETNGAVRLSGLLAASSSIEEWNLSENGIDNAGASALAKAIAHPCKALRTMDLTLNDIGSSGATELIEAAERNPKVMSLSLHGCPSLSRVAHKKLEALLATRRQGATDAAI